jgi:oligo-alginate lyase
MQRLGFCFAAIMFVSWIWASVGLAQTPTVLATLKPEHPRLYLTEAKLAEVRAQTDPVSIQLKYILKAEADRMLTLGPVIYPDNQSRFLLSREVQGRVIALAMAYQLFGDRRYLEKARTDLADLVAVKDWNTSHYLTLCEATFTAAIGLDWLYEDLSPAERLVLQTAIIDKALKPSLTEMPSGDGKSWVNGNFNWNPVCHASLSAGALVVADQAPNLSAQILERAIKYLPIAGAAYAPDGVYAEGPSYWSYGTSFYVLAIEALRSSLGQDFGLAAMPGVLKTADYNNQMVAPSGEDVNYSDYYVENLNEPIMLWFARETGQPDLMGDEMADLARLEDRIRNGKQTLSGKLVLQSRHMPFELLWWDPKLLTAKTTPMAPLHWTAQGEMPIGVMRSGWGDPKASFVTLKGGTPHYSHGHMDIGSFILEAQGVRWAVDLGTESYGNMRAAKLDLWDYSQDSNRWSTFRVGPEGHNILRFSDHRQVVAGKGEVRVLKPFKGGVGNIADLSSVYAGQAQSVTRTLKLLDNKTVSISDEWILGDKPSEVSFQWLTKASVTKTKDGFLLQQDGQTLRLKIKAPHALSWAIEDVSTSKAIQDSDNKDLKRLMIKAHTKANRQGRFNILAIPEGS